MENIEKDNKIQNGQAKMIWTLQRREKDVCVKQPNLRTEYQSEKRKRNCVANLSLKRSPD